MLVSLMVTPILILAAFVVSLVFMLLRRRFPIALKGITGLHVVLGALVVLNLFLYGQGISWRGPNTGHIRYS